MKGTGVAAVVLLGVVLGCNAPTRKVVYDDPFHRGKALCDEGKFEKALPLFSEYIKKHPDAGFAYLWRAVCYSKLGKHDEAMADVEMAKRLFPVEEPADEDIPEKDVPDETE